MPERLVYISGEYFAEADAKISVFDSAVMLADTATESTRTFLQKPFKLEPHVRRLYQSLKIMRRPGGERGGDGGGDAGGDGAEPPGVRRG